MNAAANIPPKSIRWGTVPPPRRGERVRGRGPKRHYDKNSNDCSIRWKSGSTIWNESTGASSSM